MFNDGVNFRVESATASVGGFYPPPELALTTEYFFECLTDTTIIPWLAEANQETMFIGSYSTTLEDHQALAAMR